MHLKTAVLFYTFLKEKDLVNQYNSLWCTCVYTSAFVPVGLSTIYTSHVDVCNTTILESWPLTFILVNNILLLFSEMSVEAEVKA